MHEVAIMTEAVRLAVESAQMAGAKRVTTLKLRIGALSGVVPEALQFAWEVARRVRRRIRGRRVLDLAGGHGLLAQALLLLDDTSPSAVVVDRVVPPSAATLSERLAATWPRLRGRVAYEVGDLGAISVSPDDLVVSCHACGALSDAVLTRAIDARAAVAVLPCCHDDGVSDAGVLAGWLTTPMAIDVMRAMRLQGASYTVWTQTIPEVITPQNRLLIGVPRATVV